MEEIKDDMHALKMGKTEAEREVEALKREKEDVLLSLTSREEIETTREAERRLEYETLSREVTQARAKLGPLEAEKKAEQARNAALLADLTEKAEKVASLEEELVKERVRSAQYKATNDGFSRLEDQYKQEIDSLTHKNQAQEGALSSASELATQSERTFQDTQRQAADLNSRNKALEDEMRELTMQLESVGNDLHSQTVARRQDKARFEARVDEQAQELASLREASKAKDREIQANAQQREAAQSETRRGPRRHRPGCKKRTGA